MIAQPDGVCPSLRLHLLRQGAAHTDQWVTCQLARHDSAADTVFDLQRMNTRYKRNGSRPSYGSSIHSSLIIVATCRSCLWRQQGWRWAAPSCPPADPLNCSPVITRTPSHTRMSHTWHYRDEQGMRTSAATSAHVAHIAQSSFKLKGLAYQVSTHAPTHDTLKHSVR